MTSLTRSLCISRKNVVLIPAEYQLRGNDSGWHDQPAKREISPARQDKNHYGGQSWKQLILHPRVPSDTMGPPSASGRKRSRARQRIRPEKGGGLCQSLLRHLSALPGDGVCNGEPMCQSGRPNGASCMASRAAQGLCRTLALSESLCRNRETRYGAGKLTAAFRPRV